MINLNPKKSLFIAVEGIDFSGKTTLIEELKGVLEKDPIISGYFDQIIYTKEPNGNASEFCGQIRQIALNNPQINNFTRALIFFASRSEHIEQVIDPARKVGGCLIICDRFYLSTLVYQIQKNEELIEWAQNTQRIIAPFTPDWTYFIKVNKNVFLSRYENNRGREKNHLDEVVYSKFEEISSLYNWFIEEKDDLNIGEIRHLDGNSDDISYMVKQVQRDIQEKVKDLVSRRS